MRRSSSDASLDRSSKGGPMMDRRTFAALWTIGLLFVRHSHAQPRGKVFKIGLLLAASEPTAEFRPSQEALRTALSHLGWTEGKDLMIETRWGGSNPQR